MPIAASSEPEARDRADAQRGRRRARTPSARTRTAAAWRRPARATSWWRPGRSRAARAAAPKPRCRRAEASDRSSVWRGEREAEGRRQRDERRGDDHDVDAGARASSQRFPRRRDRGPDDERQDDGGGREHIRHPVVAAGEREQRDAEEDGDGAGARRTIRPRLRRSSSCTGGRSSANSSTCFARNRPCSARRPRTAGAPT